MAEMKRIFIEKRPGFDVEAKHMLADLRDNLGIQALEGVRLINRYDVEGLDDKDFALARDNVFSEPNVDLVYEETLPALDGWHVFATEYLPGQYDQRADSAVQCIQLLLPHTTPVIVTARVLALSGALADSDVEKIKRYCINPIESRIASMDKPLSLDLQADRPDDVATIDGFTSMDESALRTMLREYGLAMDYANLKFTQEYFAQTEKRDPTVTELRILDTYWSDHCRHTTFTTIIDELAVDEGAYSDAIEDAVAQYRQVRDEVYDTPRPVTLMDMATVGAKRIKKRGLLADLDESEEINACSINIKVDVDGELEDWLLQFKNETHNHPTEIEPFGGAATCLGGAIRDILSGRAYAHQSMRITGSGDPNTPYADTLPGKLPQRKITTSAAAGFSSYGNQIGLATGLVNEIYDDGYVAKRMELGAVVGACPKRNVKREEPLAGDVVILLGGRTGRDGIGGATGSSKEHDASSLDTCGSEVQKGNALTERKIQRLLRNEKCSTLIKRCNDFGAGGVSVAIGELARGLDIDLDKVPRKYEGLDGTELAISESQERMAVVVDPGDVETFICLSDEENLEATVVATVTDTDRMRITWRGQTVADIARTFLDTNGVTAHTTARIAAVQGACYLDEVPDELAGKPLRDAWLGNLRRLNVCSQKGLVERFDNNIGAATVLMPFGGAAQLTPEEGMVAKIPVLHGETDTASAMAYGYLPKLAKWSPFHGGAYAVVESLSRMAAMGVDALKSRISMQEYFERLGNDESKWGKPAAALLGALAAQKALDIPAIGGKDSMSGTFEDLDVPPTIISFAVGATQASKTVSACIRQPEQEVYLYRLPVVKQTRLPDWEAYKAMLQQVYELAQQGKIAAASVVREGGLAATLTRMCLGNGIGFDAAVELSEAELFAPDCGSIVLCMESGAAAPQQAQRIGTTNERGSFIVNGNNLLVDEMTAEWASTLENVFPTTVAHKPEPAPVINHYFKQKKTSSNIKVAKPRIVIPVFPGTNSEYDSARAFEKAGGIVETVVLNNLSGQGIRASIDRLASVMEQSQILMLPGGFSGGDEPDGSGKFIATVLRNAKVEAAVATLLQKNDGLILGICNGFQALIKTGLLPTGEICEIAPDAPTLTFNSLGRHVACLSYTRVQSTISPWMRNCKAGDMHAIPVSHGEGRFTATRKDLEALFEAGQVATQYTDTTGEANVELPWNPNGSDCAIEGITSPDGKIFGKMGHSERVGKNVAINIPFEHEQGLFTAGVAYFE